MSDPAKVRLVRCPKCEKLLPELEGYSVYQCGGCGAVLRANSRDSEMDPYSQNSGEERVQVFEENLYGKPDNTNIPEKKESYAEGFDNDVRSQGSSSRKDEKPDEKLKAGKWVVDDDLERNETLLGYSEMKGKIRDSGPYTGNIIGSQRSGSFADWTNGSDRHELEGFPGNRKPDFQALRYSTSNYQEDGPSNYAMKPNYGYGERIYNRDGAKDLSKVEYLEQDRVELLRQLDELKDKISRSCDIGNKPKDKVPLDPRIAQQEVAYMNKPFHASQYNEASPYINRHEKIIDPYYESLRTELPRRASYQEPNPYLPGSYIHEKIDPYVQPYPRDMNVHHPNCSCVYCYNNHPRVTPSVPPTDFHNKTLHHEPYNPMLYRHENKSSFGPLDFSSNRMNSRPLGTHNPQQHTRWEANFNSDVRGYGSRGPQKMLVTSGKRRCLPVAGGAPLVLCDNCFQLVELPNKLSPTRTNHVKVRCGACLTILSLAVVDKKLVSVNMDANLSPNMAVKNPVPVSRRTNLHSHVRANQASTNFSSEDYDNLSYDFKFLDREGRGFGSNDFETIKSLHSASSFSSEHAVSPDSMNPQEAGPNSAELQGKTVLSPPLTGSPLQDHFDYSSRYRLEKGNQSGHSDREKTELQVLSTQNSVKDASMATEMELSFHEDIETGTSLESADRSKDEDQLRRHKGGQSFFAGIIKKSFKDLSKSNNTVEQTSSNVMINGHPITDRSLKKAEKIAGPVHPGQYWYDNRAGFWGVIGGPCLGIIPPFIEEFNYPMSEDCSGGNTGVLVNGRELHHKDLNLLSSRGLPPTRDRSYIIEISGRVLDEDTGEELPSLGKLAPTIEKVKHGFGMKVPRKSA